MIAPGEGTRRGPEPGVYKEMTTSGFSRASERMDRMERTMSLHHNHIRNRPPEGPFKVPDGHV